MKFKKKDQLFQIINSSLIGNLNLNRVIVPLI